MRVEVYNHGHKGAKLDEKFGFGGLSDLLTLFGPYLEFRKSDLNDLTAYAKLIEFSLIQR